MRVEMLVGIQCILMGIFALIAGLVIKDSLATGFGIALVVLGLYTVLMYTTTNQYTEWRIQDEKEYIIPITEERYVQDVGDELWYRVLNYTDDGKRLEENRHVEKNEDTFIEFVEIDEVETACCYIFTRENKSLLGWNNGIVQTKYVFYIPKN